MDKEQIIKEVEHQVELELQGIYNKGELGYINKFEKRKKELLREKGIEWKTTMERYEGMFID